MVKQINNTNANSTFYMGDAVLIVTRQYRAGKTVGLCYRLLHGAVARKGATLLIGSDAGLSFIAIVRLLARKLGIDASADVFQSFRVYPGVGGSYESASVIFPNAIAPNDRAKMFAMIVAEHATLRVTEYVQKPGLRDYGLNVQVIINGAQHSKLYPSGELDFAAEVHNHRTNALTPARAITRPRLVPLYTASIMRLIAHTNR